CAVNRCGLAFDDAVREARNAEASIHPLDPDGLSVPGFCSPEAGGGPCESSSGRGNARSPLNALNVLAADTGGFVIADANRIKQGRGRVIDSSNSYYLIG